MKRVLIWGMTSNWGGIESILFNYVKHANKEEISFDFITTFQSIPRFDELELLGCKIYYLPDRRTHIWNYRKEINNFFKVHAKEYDAFWLNDCMFANIDALKLAKKYGIKKRILHAHNSNSLGGGKSRILRHKFNSMLLPLYVTDYWACSQLAGEWSYSEKILSSNRYRVINNAIDCERYAFDKEKRDCIRKQLGIREDVFVVGHVGRFDYQKNHPYLLDLFSKFRKKHSNSLLLSIGTGSDFEVIRAQARKLGIDENVMFLGQRSDVDSLFQGMDIFVLPSQFEGLPVVLVEALSSGLPCVISDKVTKESAIIPELCEFESIDGDSEAWISDIEYFMKECERVDTTSKMQMAGFDIKTQASIFHELF